MPVVDVFGYQVGVAPMLQWIVVPKTAFWRCRRNFVFFAERLFPNIFDQRDNAEDDQDQDKHAGKTNPAHSVSTHHIVPTSHFRSLSRELKGGIAVRICAIRRFACWDWPLN